MLVAAVHATTLSGESPEEIAGLRQLLQERAADIGTEQGRRDLIVEGLRRSADQDVRRLVGSQQWRTYFALTASLNGLPAGEIRDEVGAALAKADHGFTERRTRVYRRLATMIGYRLAPQFAAAAGFEGLASASGTVMSGIVVKALASPGMLTRTVRMAPFGSSEEADWTEPALMAVGVLMAFLEPDPQITWDDAQLAAVAAAIDDIEVKLREEAQRPAGGPA